MRKYFIFQTLLDEFPAKSTLSNGESRYIRRATKKMLNLWKISDGLWEAKSSYDLYQGGDFLDIGAYNGFYSFNLANKATSGNRFISFEPDLKALTALLKNLAEASRIFSNVKFSTLMTPVGDGSFCSTKYLHESGVHPSFYSGNDNHGSQDVQSTRLDDVVSIFGLQPAFVKIDVEGAEIGVLKGMRNILLKNQPILMLEIHPLWLPQGENYATVSSFLTDLNYQLISERKTNYAIRTFWRYKDQ